MIFGVGYVELEASDRKYAAQFGSIVEHSDLYDLAEHLREQLYLEIADEVDRFEDNLLNKMTVNKAICCADRDTPDAELLARKLRVLQGVMLGRSLEKWFLADLEDF